MQSLTTLLISTALNVTAATATHTVSQATADVTVTLSKDLATSDDITISVSLNKDLQGQGIYFGPLSIVCKKAWAIIVSFFF